MTERPILFSTDMVQAIQHGTKTMTRRTIKGLPKNASDDLVQIIVSGHHGEYGHVLCPYGKVGDLLYVRETWMRINDSIEYKADCSSLALDNLKGCGRPWKPGIHLRKEDSRIWLKVTSVKVERLHDISEDDAKAEGVKLHERGEKWLNYVDRQGRVTQFIYNCRTAKKSFLSLWQMINKGENVHRINPWVWVISFEILSTTGRPA